MPRGIAKNPELKSKRISEAKLKNPTRYWLGKKLPEAMSQKLRTINIGRKHTQEWKDKMSVFQKNRKRGKFSEESRLKMSESQKRIKRNNPISKSKLNLLERRGLKYRIWRSAIYARDLYTCQACNDKTGGNLVGHHILNFSKYIELRYEISNGITLCSECHDEFHKVYGLKNNTREQLDEFLSENPFITHT